MPVYSLEASINPLTNTTVGNYKVFSHERLSEEITTLTVHASLADEGGPLVGSVLGTYSNQLSRGYLKTVDATVNKIIGGMETRFVGSESRLVRDQGSKKELLPYYATNNTYGTHLGIIDKNISYTTLPTTQFLSLATLHSIRNN